MTTTTQPSRDSHLPAPASIALALAVLRSKPQDVDLDEHLDRITSCISREPSSTHRVPSDHLDAIIYWKEESRRANSEKSKLQDEILELRLQLEGSKQSGKPSQKRNAEPQIPSEANTQSKRRRLSGNNEDFNGPDALEQLDKACDPDIKHLLRSLFTLKQLLGGNSNDARRVFRWLSTLCTSMVNLVKRPTELSPRLPKAYGCMLLGLRRIRDLVNDQEDMFTSAISTTTRLFQTMLGCLHQIALDEVARREREEQRKSKKHKSNTKAVKTSGPDSEVLCKTNLAALMQMLSIFFAQLEHFHKSDRVLYECICSALLDHIGSSLSLLVFLDPQSEETGLKSVTGIVDVAHLEPESAISTARLSAPYLVRVLRTALGSAAKDDRGGKGQTQRVPGNTSIDRSSHGALQLRAEERLQHTLLRGIFGDEDERFPDALLRAEEMDGDVHQETVEEAYEEQDSSDWFIGQVWELLGWDILSGTMPTSRRLCE